tara:strand:+ start:56040 stop:57251 length:1212 start_codon:yes stop_codon:yes gene_type:complete
MLAPVAAIAGLLAFATVAIFGFGKEDGSWMGDFFWYFAGGKCFLMGSNMYDTECFAPILKELYNFTALAGLSYPPHFGPMAALFAIPPLFYSVHIFYVANILASLAMAVIVSKTISQTFGSRENGLSLSHLWALLLVMGSSGIWAAVWLGQFVIFAAICLWLAFQQIERGNDFNAAALLALASVKPQIAALVFLWLLLHGRFKILFIAGLIAAFLSSYTFAQMGIIPAIEGWFNGLGTYQQYPVNQLGNNSVMGIPSFLALYGISIPLPVATSIGALLIVFLRFRSNVAPYSPMALATILLVQMSVFSRPPDLILIAPVFALFWPTERSHILQTALFMLAMAVYCFPQQLVVKALPLTEAGHFRTLLLIVLTVAFIRQMLRGMSSFDCNAPRQQIPSIQTIKS